MTQSVPLDCNSVASATVSGDSKRTPPISPMHAAYIRASDRASLCPFDEGICAPRSRRVFHMSS